MVTVGFLKCQHCKCKPASANLQMHQSFLEQTVYCSAKYCHGILDARFLTPAETAETVEHVMCDVTLPYLDMCLIT